MQLCDLWIETDIDFMPQKIEIGGFSINFTTVIELMRKNKKEYSIHYINYFV